MTKYDDHKKKIIGCIISRMKSTRLPGKAMADIHGKPMIERLINRIKTAKSIDQIVVCTSSDKEDEVLIDKAKECGVESFAGSHEDVLSRIISAGVEYKADILVRITGDNVLTCPETIDRMVKQHLRSDAEYTRTNGLPIGVTAEVMNLDMLIRIRTMISDPKDSEYLMLYAYDPDKFRCAILNAALESNRPHYSLTVDTIEDLKFIRQIYSEYPNLIDGPPIADVVAKLDADPKYHGIPDDTPVKMPGGVTMRYGECLKMLSVRAEKAKNNWI